VAICRALGRVDNVDPGVDVVLEEEIDEEREGVVECALEGVDDNGLRPMRSWV
jgi:hypothetical protein